MPDLSGLDVASLYALEAVKKKRYDCILMDIQMPGMDGYETTGAIRKFEKESGIAPHYIIAMTAHVMKGDKERCLAAGMDNYIAKLEKALADKDYKHGYFVVHSIKSVVGFFGHEATADLLGRLEEACEKKREDTIQFLSEEVLDALHALLQDIEAVLEEA